jgi:hypothetical protein
MQRPSSLRGRSRKQSSAPIIAGVVVVALLVVIGVALFALNGGSSNVVALLSEVRIDGTTEESCKASIDKVKAALRGNTRLQFEAALRLVAAHGLSIEDARTPGGMDRARRDNLHGKTAAEVLESGRRIAKQRVAQMRQDLEDDREEIKKSESALAALEAGPQPSTDDAAAFVIKTHYLQQAIDRGKATLLSSEEAIAKAVIDAELLDN